MRRKTTLWSKYFIKAIKAERRVYELSPFRMAMDQIYYKMSFGREARNIVIKIKMKLIHLRTT